MSDHFVLQIGGVTQRRYAWFEPVDASHGEAPRCPACGDFLGGKRWLPPHRVEIREPRRVGDFVYGTGGSDFAVSARFKTAYERAGLRGIEAFLPLEVVRMGTTPKAQSYPKPTLYGVEIQRGPGRVDYERSNAAWWERPQPDYCRVSGPGGGGKGGVVEKLGPLVLEPETWKGEDFFHPINMASCVVLSERGAALIDLGGFENVVAVRAEDWRYQMMAAFPKAGAH